MVRWYVDRHLTRQAESEAGDVANDPEARARAEIEAIRKSETSPGVLLASGYIAGGSLAGVVAAFFEFPMLKTLKGNLDLSKAVDEVNKTPLFESPFLFTAGDFIALGLFSLLIFFAVAVGLGLVLKPPEERPGQHL